MQLEKEDFLWRFYIHFFKDKGRERQLRSSTHRAGFTTFNWLSKQNRIEQLTLLNAKATKEREGED